MTATAPTQRYQFRNSPHQLHPLQEMLDPVTLDDLTRLGVNPGHTALDVGAGAGSIARHLCELVGRTGKVIAVDIDTSMLNPTGVLDVYQRDLRTQPLPVEPGTIDVATARCVLEHLPNRHPLLHQMINALRPGGHLVLGEIVYAPVSAHAPADSDNDLVTRVVHTILDVLAGRGVDLHWGDKVPSFLLANGFEQVHTRWVAETWAGGSAGCRLYADNATQLRDRLLAEDLSHDELDRFAELMADPAVLVRGYQFASTTGRKPR
ncbi:methyltransferase domain-containing protein [Micromonospora sp. WMMD1155]|uniref:class I SAM-dependent methyltransferase n=1 Tax=Micromonospora sp. WMMD1155 TaxID=3016094 RepID=UPI00249B8D74|nr:methyltransferase domain-containing protein [Micromonospora sp. WMMD1155]WFE51202.1 methyltransferase domain-containing protein [Micromonospora sp. WMMD1155]